MSGNSIVGIGYDDYKNNYMGKRIIKEYCYLVGAIQLALARHGLHKNRFKQARYNGMTGIETFIFNNYSVMFWVKDDDSGHPGYHCVGAIIERWKYKKVKNETPQAISIHIDNINCLEVDDFVDGIIDTAINYYYPIREINYASHLSRITSL